LSLLEKDGTSIIDVPNIFNHQLRKNLNSRIQQKFFNTVNKTKLTNVFQIVSFVLSIPSSNALVESVFSVMNSKWSDTRNRASVELI